MAGKDITGGAYYLGKGEGIITAGGEITGSTQTSNLNAFIDGPQLLMSGDQADSVSGSTKLALNASQGIKISAVSDAMVSSTPLDTSLFFTYTDKDNLALRSLSGDVHLDSNTSKFLNTMGINNSDIEALSKVYPASLDVTAFNGNVILDNDIILFPSRLSNLNILAEQAISSNIITGSSNFASIANVRCRTNPISYCQCANYRIYWCC